MKKLFSFCLSVAFLFSTVVLYPLQAYAAPVAVPEKLSPTEPSNTMSDELLQKIETAQETLQNDQEVLDLLYGKIAALNAQVVSAQTAVSECSAAESQTVDDLKNQLNEHARTYAAMENRYSQDAVKLQSLCDSQESSEAIKMVIQYKNIYDCSNLPFTVNVNNNASTFHPLEDIEADEKTKTELYAKYEFLRTEIYTLYKRLTQGSIPFEVVIGFDENLDSESKLKMIQWYCGFLAAFDDYLANNFISDDPEELLEAWSAYRSAFDYSKGNIQELYSQANAGNNALTVKYVNSAKEREEYIRQMKLKAAEEEANKPKEQPPVVATEEKQPEEPKQPEQPPVTPPSDNPDAPTMSSGEPQ